MSTLKAVKSAQFVPSSLKYLNRVLTSHCNSRPRQPDLSWLGKHGRDSLELKSVRARLKLARNHLLRSVQQSNNAQSDFSRNPHTPAASRSLPQVVPQPLMSTIDRATHKESSATKIIENKGWNRQKSREETFGEHCCTQNHQTTKQEESYNRNHLFLSTKPAATIRRCIYKGTSKRRRSATTTDDRFLPKQPTAGIRLLTQSVTTPNDVASGIRHPRCQQLIKPSLVTLHNSNDDVSRTRHLRCQQLIQRVAPKTLSFNLSKRRRLTSTTGSSNQQLVSRLKQFLTNATADSATISSQH
ncbi:hypothetical protein F511_19253 [Dorcoceras hygrometricum]|uniref:Uncharacterized protein n=1 Tax=Dorcoceras hygrometricum TaxID=472368 RepID=A0A2Z7CPM0_9LAMI|nr:hypothetical protein F511_19253 [Dorcoceras hygrometricum]